MVPRNIGFVKLIITLIYAAYCGLEFKKEFKKERFQMIDDTADFFFLKARMHGLECSFGFEPSRRHRAWAIRYRPATVSALGPMTIAEYLLGFNLRIEELLVEERPVAKSRRVS